MASSKANNESNKKLCDTIFVNDSFELADEPEPHYKPCITADDFEFEVSFEDPDYSHNVSDLEQTNCEVSVADTTMLEPLEEPEKEKLQKSVADNKDDPDSTEILDMVAALTLDDDAKNEGEKFDLQQTTNYTWELRNFKANLANYLDAESSDGTELCALRTVLFKNGENIGLPTTYLANLYMTEWSDENQNVNEGNRNLKEEREQEKRGGNQEKDLFMEVNVKLVDMEGEDELIAERLVYTNFKVTVHTIATGFIATMCTPIFCTRLNHQLPSTSVKIRWNLLKSALKPSEPLYVTIHHYIYRSPKEWGLNPKQELIMKKFAENPKVNQEDTGDVEDIIKKCEQKNLKAVVEGLKAAHVAIK